MEKETKFIVLVSIFMVALTTSILSGAKIIEIAGITFSAAVISYVLTFPVTDVISEVWGKQKAKKVIWLGLLAMALSTTMIYIAIALPSASFWEGQEGYKQTLGLAGRFFVAGIVAFVVSQNHDVWAFHYWRDKTKGKHLWWRNNASTFASQALDTILFIGIAFYGILPNSALFATMFGQYIFKVVIAAIDTPFVYLLVNWAKKEDNLKL